MKKLTLSLMILVFGGLLIGQTNWTTDRGHSSIRFTTTHMMIAEVGGEFKDFNAEITSYNEDFSDATVNFTAEVASISTNNERRDGHLKSGDFFEAEKYPQLKFAGKILKEGDKYYLVGDFTMKDVTQPVKFDVKYNGTIPGRRGKKAGFKVTGTVNRFDYNLEWENKIANGSLVVAEDVEITCNVEMNEKVAEN